MANEYKITVKTSLDKGSHKESFNPGEKKITQSGVGFHGPVLDIGTSEEVISFGDIGTEGRCEILNLDETNFVTIGPESSSVMVGCIKLTPGEPHAFRLKPGVTWRAQADTAACKVQLRVYED